MPEASMQTELSYVALFQPIASDGGKAFFDRLDSDLLLTVINQSQCPLACLMRVCKAAHTAVRLGMEQGVIARARRIRGLQPIPQSLPSFSESRTVAASFSPNGAWFVTAARDHRVRLYSSRPAGSAPCLVLRAHRSPVLCIAWSPCGNCIISGANDGSLIVWAPTPDSWLPAQTCRLHVDPVKLVTFSPSGDCVCSVAGRHLQIWRHTSSHGNPKSQPKSQPKLDDLPLSLHLVGGQVSPIAGEVPMRLVPHMASVPGTLAGAQNRMGAMSITDMSIGIDHCGKECVLCSVGPSVVLISAEDGELIQKLLWKGDESGPTAICLAWLPDGILAVGYADNLIRIWDTKLGECLRELKKHTAPVQGLGFTSCGTRLVSAALAFGMLHLCTWDWRQSCATLVHGFRTPTEMGLKLGLEDWCRVRCSPCRTLVAVTTESGYAALFEAAFAVRGRVAECAA